MTSRGSQRPTTDPTLFEPSPSSLHSGASSSSGTFSSSSMVTMLKLSGALSSGASQSSSLGTCTVCRGGWGSSKSRGHSRGTPSGLSTSSPLLQKNVPSDSVSTRGSS